ncbi:hypothetical protein CPB86DRAFT_485768 [Serendipita vermifera]|nr:hypothetical protein CPB86DRAFT_485768 [Serendipita vermifera]
MQDCTRIFQQKYSTLFMYTIWWVRKSYSLIMFGTDLTSMCIYLCMSRATPRNLHKIHSVDMSYLFVNTILMVLFSTCFPVNKFSSSNTMTKSARVLVTRFTYLINTL